MVLFALRLLKVVRKLVANGHEPDEVPVHVGWVFRGTLDRRWRRLAASLSSEETACCGQKTDPCFGVESLNLFVPQFLCL